MSIEQEGFLSQDIKHWVSKIRAEHDILFTLAADTNRICQESMLALEPNSANGQQVITATLFLRCVSTYQGIVILAERCMIPQASVLTRALLEVVFTLCALCRNEKLVADYVNEDKVYKLKLIDKLRKYHKEDFPEPEKVALLEQALKSEKGEKNIVSRSTQKWAEDAGLLDIYLITYTGLSATAHVKVSDLDRHIIADAEGNIKDFNWGPNDVADFDLVLMTSIDVMLYALKHISDLFGIKKDDIVKLLRKRLEEATKEESGTSLSP